MAFNNFGYFYDFLGLSDLKVVYDFSGSSGGFIPSVSPALPIHSGQLNSVNLLNDSGIFESNSSIRISNIDSSFNTLGTHIFSYERTGLASPSGLLFSCLQTGALNSGYNIGLTDSNLLFFEYIGANGPTVVNSDLILAEKNAIAVLIGNNSVSFNLYNFNTRAFETNTISIISNQLLFSDRWEIRGLGNTLGNYLYFNKNVTTSNLTRLFSGLYATPTGFPAVSGSEIYTETIGYTQVGSFGEDSFNVQFSGFDSEFFQLLNGQFGDPVIWGEASDLFLFSGGSPSGVDSFPSGIYGAFITGASGNLTGDFDPFYYASSFNSYIYSGGQNYPYSGDISGIFIMFDSELSTCPKNPVFDLNLQNFTGDPLTLTPIVIEKTGFFQISAPYSGYIEDSGVLSSYGMSQVSYLWSRGDDQIGQDSTEILTFTGGIQTQTLRKNAVFDLVKGEFSAGGFYPSGNSNFFLNGLFQLESGYTTGGNVFEPTQTKIADYFTDGQYFNTNQFAQSDDFSVYDFAQQQNRVVIPSVYSGQTLISGNTYNFSNKSVFLNGQRLISGSDYTLSGLNFIGNSGITGVDGFLYLVNNYTGQYQYTGGYNYTGLSLPKFSRGSSIYYLNGVRINPSLRIEHSRYDKIAGEYIFDDTSESLLTSSSSVLL